MSARSLFGHRFEDRLFDVDGQPWIELGRCHWLDFGMLIPPDFQAPVGHREGFVPGDQLIGKTAQGILIALHTHHPLKLLGCHVGWGATSTQLPGSGCRQDHCDAKIGQKRLTLPIEENIAWLEVTMDNPLLMGEVQRLADLAEDAKRFVEWERGMWLLVETVS